MFTVKVITAISITASTMTRITERIGLRGEKVLISIESPKGTKVNPKPRKVESWKTKKSSMKYIEESLKIDMQTGKDSWYQIEETI